MNDCASIVRHKRLATKVEALGDKEQIPLRPDHASWYLPLCAELTYLVVVTVAEGQTASAGGFDKTFQGGRVRGDVLVFNLVNGKYLGGVPFEATSSKEVRVADGSSASERVRADLAVAVHNSIAASLNKALPDARF